MFLFGFLHTTSWRKGRPNSPHFEQGMKGLVWGVPWTAGGLRVKSYFKYHFLLLMVSSKGQVDHDVWLQCVACLWCASLCPFKHLILFLEHNSRRTRAPEPCLPSFGSGVTSTMTRKLPLLDRPLFRWTAPDIGEIAVENARNIGQKQKKEQKACLSGYFPTTFTIDF